MISSILWPHFPAIHTDGKNPAANSSVLSHSWPQNQISHVGSWAKGTPWQIPTEVDCHPSPSPLPLGSPDPGQMRSYEVQGPPSNSTSGEGRAVSAIWPRRVEQGGWCQVTTRAASQGRPRCTSLNGWRQSYSTQEHKRRAKTLVALSQTKIQLCPHFHQRSRWGGMRVGLWTWHHGLSNSCQNGTCLKRHGDLSILSWRVPGAGPHSAILMSERSASLPFYGYLLPELSQAGIKVHVPESTHAALSLQSLCGRSWVSPEARLRGPGKSKTCYPGKSPSFNHMWQP